MATATTVAVRITEARNELAAKLFEHNRKIDRMRRAALLNKAAAGMNQATNMQSVSSGRVEAWKMLARGVEGTVQNTGEEGWSVIGSIGVICNTVTACVAAYHLAKIGLIAYNSYNRDRATPDINNLIEQVEEVEQMLSGRLTQNEETQQLVADAQEILEGLQNRVFSREPLEGDELIEVIETIQSLLNRVSEI